MVVELTSNKRKLAEVIKSPENTVGGKDHPIKAVIKKRSR